MVVIANPMESAKQPPFCKNSMCKTYVKEHKIYVLFHGLHSNVPPWIRAGGKRETEGRERAISSANTEK